MLGKYLGGRTFPVEIAEGITAYLELTEQVAPLTMVELHQSAGDLQAAIAVVEAPSNRPRAQHCPWPSCTPTPAATRTSST